MIMNFILYQYYMNIPSGMLEGEVLHISRGQSPRKGTFHLYVHLISLCILLLRKDCRDSCIPHQFSYFHILHFLYIVEGLIYNFGLNFLYSQVFLCWLPHNLQLLERAKRKEDFLMNQYANSDSF